MFTDPWSAHYVCYPGTCGAPLNLWDSGKYLALGVRTRCRLTTGRLSATVYTTGYGNFSVASFLAERIPFTAQLRSVHFASGFRKYVRTSLMTDDVNRAGWRLVSLNLVIGYHKSLEVGGTRLAGRLSSFVRAFHALLDNNAGRGGWHCAPGAGRATPTCPLPFTLWPVSPHTTHVEIIHLTLQIRHSILTKSRSWHAPRL